MEFKLTEEQENLLQTGSRIKSNNYDLYYLPYYFNKLENGNFEILQFHELPEEVLKHIEKERDE